MIYAENKQGGKVLAGLNREGFCPTCQSLLVPKCGRVKIWHWAHKAKPDCDNWAEGETAWHSEWKERFHQGWCEKTIENVFGRHRADVFVPGGGVIEFQNSSISVDEIREREEFYGNMIWVLNATYDAGFGKNIFCPLQDSLKLAGIDRRKDSQFYRWKFPRKTWQHAKRTIYLDRGFELLKIIRFHEQETSDEWGSRTVTEILCQYVSHEEFVRTVATPKFWGTK